MDLNLSAKQFEGFAASPSEIKSAVVTFPQGLTVNPDAADGQSACSDDQANFGSEGPANCPDNSKIGTLSVGSPTLDGRLKGSLYFGEPKPGNQYRIFMIFSGFGMNAKLVGSVKPDPRHRADHDLLRRPAPGPVRRLRHPPLRLRSRPGRDPDPLHDLRPRRQLLPLERNAAGPALGPAVRPRQWPARRPVPGRGAPVPAAARGRDQQPQRRRLLQLPPQTRPRRRRPVPRRSQLQDAPGLHRRPARHRLLPGIGDPRRRPEPRPFRAGPAELSGVLAGSARPTSPPAPEATRSTRSG